MEGGECWPGQEGREKHLSTSGCTLCLLSPQGSSKLEKAEVLQMTVDHLKMLHASGGAGNSALFSRELLTLQVLRHGAPGSKG